MAVPNLNIDNLFFQKLKNNPVTNSINAEDLDRQFLFVSTYINTILTPAINELTNGEIVDDGGENPVGKFLFNNKDGVVELVRLDPNLIPDGYFSWKSFGKGAVGSILIANNEEIFTFLTPPEGDMILHTNESGATWNGSIHNDYVVRGFGEDDKLTGDKFARRTLRPEHIRPGTLVPNIPDEIARTSKITNSAVTRGKIAAGSLELGNFTVSASFPFLRLYGLMKPNHFNDGAITSSIIQNNSIDLKNFINYRWTDYEINNLGYTIFNKYPELSRPEGSDWFSTNTSVFRDPNTFYFYYYSTYYNIGVPTLNPRLPVTYYFPRKSISTSNHAAGSQIYVSVFCKEPYTIPPELVTFKYKYVTMGKLANKAVKSHNFALGNYEQNPRPVAVYIKFFIDGWASSDGSATSSVNLSRPLYEGSKQPFYIGGGSAGDFANLKSYQYERRYDTGRAIPDIYDTLGFFISGVNDAPCTLIDSTAWFGGQLLQYSLREHTAPQRSNYDRSVFRLKNIHIKPGTVGRRHFLPQQLQAMKAAADAKFNG